MDIFTITCPNCSSLDIKIDFQYKTFSFGLRNLLICKNCTHRFSETKNTFLQGLRKPIILVWQVLNARTEGLQLNAATRIFGIAKNTLLSWENKFSDLYQVLFLYSIANSFCQLVIEGDELYTKVNKNVPQDESSGWTIMLMNRASRFILELSCGKKDRSLFKKAIKTIEQLINTTEDLTLLTDGERRYGNLLFEICYELIKTGKAGRPRKTLKKGIKVRVKNKGDQARKKGRKRPKYQAPWQEHPETDKELADKDIHANHVEAQNSVMRRKCSAYKRKTNSYAKSTDGLQRILNVYWVIHNFIRVHFTTKEVPAVALGVIEHRISPLDLFKIRLA